MLLQMDISVLRNSSHSKQRIRATLALQSLIRTLRYTHLYFYDARPVVYAIIRTTDFLAYVRDRNTERPKGPERVMPITVLRFYGMAKFSS